MRVIQGPFGEKDFKLFFRTDPGFSSPQDRLAPLQLREVLRRELRTRPQWRLTPIQSRTSFSASPGTTKDARKIGKSLFPVHRKATISSSAALKV